jgi:hypothetical protein
MAITKRTLATQADTAERDAQILALKRQDLSFQQIADQLGISRATAHRGFHRALPRVTNPQANAYRDEHLARLELAREVVLGILETRHVAISNGHVVSEITGTDEETGKPIYGEPYEDDGIVMAAVKTLKELDEREAKLLGLDAPVKQTVDATVNYTVGGGVDISALR